MTTKTCGFVHGVFTNTILFYGTVKLTSLNVIKILQAVLETQLSKIFLNALIQHQENQNIEKFPKPTKLTQIKEFKLDFNKGSFIIAEPGTGKHTCANDYKKKY